MQRIRIIPTLLLTDGGLVKTVKFKNPKYIGDAINAVRIFNHKEVDELVLLDIKAGVNGTKPNYREIEEIVSEAFMPIGYGGGIRSLNEIEKLFKLGVEKVILNTLAFTNPELITEATKIFGSQSIVVCVDVKKDLFGNYNIFINSGKTKLKVDPLESLKNLENLGTGEIIINSIDKDGTMSGYDLNLIKKFCHYLKIPVVASGGAGGINDFALAIEAGASAVSAGSLFVYQGIHRAVLISYIKSEDLGQFIQNKK
ncbi:MAG: AglZ/HisF2 family acetamidino modification protein [Ferruginibacter sp.]